MCMVKSNKNNNLLFTFYPNLYPQVIKLFKKSKIYSNCDLGVVLAEIVSPLEFS